MIGGRLSYYVVLSELGSGGMGTVYLGTCAEEAVGLDQGTKVALKVIHPNLLSQPGFFKRFLREAQVGETVQHENVVRTYDCDATEVDGKAAHFLVMEYVEGQNLRDLLDDLERVPEELCRHIGREVAKGLAAIHDAGAVHRDIKPENVLITEEHVVKVMDLGVARLQDEAIRLSQAGAFIGSLEYAAPEQFRSADVEPDGRADLHSLGVLLYELATGQHPYRDEDVTKVIRNILNVQPRNAGEINPQLSPFFEEVVRTLIAKDRDDRFESASDLATVLDEGEEGDWWTERAKALRVETKRPLRRIRVPRETALHGRDDDLARLHAIYDKARIGDGQVLLIEGEAGIGKTRLVDEFVGRLRQEGEDVNFLFGSYPPGGAATATGAFSEAYGEQFGAEGSAPWLTQTPALVPAFDAVLRGEPLPKDAEALTKASLGTVFVHAIRNLAAERPTILLIDDLHFAPEDARSLFMTLALAVPGHRILLVGTTRPGVDEGFIANVARLDQASQATMSRLGPKDLVRLLRDSFRSERLADELGAQIAMKSDGNPFFAFEIIRGLREGQYISQEPDGTWITTKAIKDIQVPSSLMDLVNARVADLSEEERDLLDVAACWGFEFDPSLIAAVVGLSPIPALRRFGQIERRHRLVRSVGRNYVFDHHQVQEALYGSLNEQLREEYHAAIADALETREKAADRDPAELDGASALDLCDQFLSGAQGERALRYLDVALDHLEAAYLNEQAIALVDRALEVDGLIQGTARVPLLLRKNSRLDMLAKREAQESVLAEARSLAEPAAEPSSLANIEAATGTFLLHAGRGDEALPHHERARALFEEVGDRKGEAAAINRLGTWYANHGRAEEAVALLKRSVAMSDELDDKLGMASSRHNLGQALIGLGRHEEAWTHSERALALYREAGSPQWEANISNNLGVILQRQGRLAEAKDLFERSLSIKKAVGDRTSESVTTGNLGMVMLELGRVEDAETLVESALALAREAASPRVAGYWLHSLAESAEQRGDAVTAQRRYEEALSLRREIGYRAGVATTLSALGILMLDEGRDEAARPLLAEALSLAREVGAPGAEISVLCRQALLPEGDAAAASDAFAVKRDRLTLAERMKARFSLFRSTGRPEHLAEAKRLLDYIVEHAPEAYRESMLTNVQLNREIMEAWESQKAEDA